MQEVGLQYSISHANHNDYTSLAHQTLQEFQIQWEVIVSYLYQLSIGSLQSSTLAVVPEYKTIVSGMICMHYKNVPINNFSLHGYQRKLN